MNLTRKQVEKWLQIAKVNILTIPGASCIIQLAEDWLEIEQKLAILERMKSIVEEDHDRPDQRD